MKTTAEFWQEERGAFLAKATQCEPQELMEAVDNLWSRMASRVMAEYPHDDVLRQMISMLFSQSALTYEALRIWGKPEIVAEKEMAPQQEKDLPGKAKRLLCHRLVLCGVLGMGLICSLFAGIRAWPCALIFLLGIVLAGIPVLSVKISGEEARKKMTVRIPLRTEALDHYMEWKAAILDEQIEDMKKLSQDLSQQSGREESDPTALSLCQTVWALAHGRFPVETVLYTAERYLQENGLSYLEFSREKSGWFEILPTRRESGTVFPAIVKKSEDVGGGNSPGSEAAGKDGEVLLRRGQYLRILESN